MKYLGILFLVFSVNLYSQVQTQTSEYTDIPISQSDSWKVLGNSYQIEGTSIVGDSLFVIKVIVNEEPSKTFDKVAREISKMSIINGSYEKARHFFMDGRLVILSDSIGVAVIKKQKTLGIIENVVGYRFHYKITDLLDEVNKQALPEDFSNSEIVKFTDLYKDCFNSNKLAQIYKSIGSPYSDEIPYSQFEKSFSENKMYVSSIGSLKYKYYVYLGTQGGIPGFNVYFDTEISSNKLSRKFITIVILFIKIHDEMKYMGSSWLLNN